MAPVLTAVMQYKLMFSKFYARNVSEAANYERIGEASEVSPQHVENRSGGETGRISNQTVRLVEANRTAQNRFAFRTGEQNWSQKSRPKNRPVRTAF